MTREERAKLLKNARPFVFNLESGDTDFENLSDEIYSELLGKNYLSTPRSQTAQRHHLNLALLNLIYSFQFDALPMVRYPLRPEHYKKSRYVPSATSFRAAKRCFEGLRDLGYIKVSPGYNKKRTFRQTRIRPSRTLLDLFNKYSVEKVKVKNNQVETILLKNTDKRLIRYIDTPQTIEMRNKLSIINDHLDKNLISLYIKDSEYENLNKILWIEKDKHPIDLSRKTLRRVFNNKSWEEGGRFYHGWWINLTKEYRAKIRINTKATVEVDFSRLHPEMIYAKHAGKDLTFDPYVINNSYGIDRDLGKVIFNTLINSEDRKSGSGAIRDELSSSGLPSSGASVDKVINAFFDLHSDIRSAFFTGEGIRLQYIDSQFAEEVMLHFCKIGYVALPVHDSFIVHHGLEHELIRVMQETYKNLMGVSIGTEKAREVFYFEDKPESELDDDAPVSLEDLFGDDGYGKYDEMVRKHFNGIRQQLTATQGEELTRKQKRS